MGTTRSRLLCLPWQVSFYFSDRNTDQNLCEQHHGRSRSRERSTGPPSRMGNVVAFFCSPPPSLIHPSPIPFDWSHFPYYPHTRPPLSPSTCTSLRRVLAAWRRVPGLPDQESTPPFRVQKIRRIPGIRILVHEKPAFLLFPLKNEVSTILFTFQFLFFCQHSSNQQIPRKLPPIKRIQITTQDQQMTNLVKGHDSASLGFMSTEFHFKTLPHSKYKKQWVTRIIRTKVYSKVRTVETTYPVGTRDHRHLGTLLERSAYKKITQHGCSVCLFLLPMHYMACTSHFSTGLWSGIFRTPLSISGFQLRFC
jgi:hypothetical protein